MNPEYAIAQPRHFSFPARRPFAERVLRALSRERWVFCLSMGLLLSTSAVAIRLIPTIYESRARVIIESARSTEELSSGSNNHATGVANLDTVGERVSPINNQIGLISAYPLYERTLRRLKLTRQEAPYKDLSVKAVPGTDFIEVAFRSRLPQRAADFVATLVDVYTRENLRVNRAKGAAARKFLEKRLPMAWNDLQTAQDEMERFQKANRFLGNSVETEAFARNLNDLQTRLNATRSELAFTDRKVTVLRNQMPTRLAEAVDQAGLSQEPNYQALQAQLLQAETQLIDIGSRFGPSNPQVLNAEQKRNELKSLLKQRSGKFLVGQTQELYAPMDPLRQRLAEQWFGLEAERSALTARLSEQRREQGELQARLARLPQLVKQQTQLQMEMDAARSEYLTFKEKYTLSRLAEQRELGNVRLVEPPNETNRVAWPNRLLLFAIAAVASLGLSGGLVWWRTRRRNTLDGIDEVLEALPLPLLTTVPWCADGRLSLEGHRDQFPLLNSYNLLQAILRMQPRQPQVLAICSWQNAEGRSSVATNLALLEARAGRRVLLIDADSSYPGQSGFSGGEHLVPTEAPAHPLIGWQTNLQRLPAGFDVLPLGNDQGTVLYKDWLLFLSQARERYELIVIDSPPVIYGPDATMIASMADGVLWVLRPKRLGRRTAEAAADALRTWGTRMLGLVVIGLEPLTPPSAGRLQTEPAAARLQMEDKP